MFTASTRIAPLALPGFEHIQRQWNTTYNTYTARLLPGEYYISNNNEGIYTNLGSCVAACVRDKISGIGGMNHFVLPTLGNAETPTKKTDITRYGFHAMEHLINDILQHGGKRRNLEIKIFGGSRLLNRLDDIGKRNITFIKDYLTNAGLKVASEDLGGPYSRMVLYFPHTGQVHIKRLRNLHNNTIAELEITHHTTEFIK